LSSISPGLPAAFLGIFNDSVITPRDFSAEIYLVSSEWSHCGFGEADMGLLIETYMFTPPDAPELLKSVSGFVQLNDIVMAVLHKSNFHSHALT
jgi:hypothetical protein